MPKFQVTFTNSSHVILLPPALHHAMIAHFQAMFSTHFLEKRCHEENTAKVYGNSRVPIIVKTITRIKNNIQNRHIAPPPPTTKKGTTKSYHSHTRGNSALLYKIASPKRKATTKTLKNPGRSIIGVDSFPWQGM